MAFEDFGVGSATLVVAVGTAAIGLYVFLVEPLWVLPVLEWLTPGILYRVRTREALVALSFDDGPHAVFTPEVLEILERYGAKATFFLIGERAERHPELVERIRAAGHEIGNHCWRNGTVLGYSRKRFVEELEGTERAVELGTLRRAGEKEREKTLTQRAQREEHRGHGESAVQKAGLIAATVQSGPLQTLRLRSGQEAGPTTAESKKKQIPNP